MLRKLLVITILLFPFFSKSQTCILAKKDKDKIIFGADSRRSTDNYDGKGNKVTTYLSVCKIHCENGFYFACAGIISDRCKDVLRQGAKQSSTIKQVYDFFKDNMGNPLDSILSFTKSADIDKYNSLLKGSILSQVIICHFEENSLKLFNFNGVTRYGNIAFIQWQDSIGAIGEVESISKILDSPKTWLGNTRQNIEKLIEVEVCKKPRTVGKPIDIIEIKKTGYKWLSNKKSCDINQ